MSLQSMGVQDLVEAKLYDSPAQVIQEAGVTRNNLLSNRPELRIRVAVHGYRHEEDL